MPARVTIGPSVIEPVGERVFEALGGCVIARAAGLDRPVALRPLEPSDEAQIEFLADFEREGILRVHGIVEFQGRRMAAFDCPLGEELSAVALRGGWPAAQAVAVARQMASLLRELLDAGHRHPDPKTASFFMDEAGRVELCPLAWPEAHHVGRKLVPSGVFLGSPHYAAPELLRDGGSSRTEASDNFAFGAAMYELLTGCRPFEAEDAAGILLAARDTVPDVTSIPEQVGRICLRCLEKAPERRFPTFAAVEAALRIAAEGLPDGSSVSEPISTIATGAPAVRRTGLTRLSGLVATAAVLAAIVGMLVVISGRGAPARTDVPAASVMTHAEALARDGRREEAALLLRAHPALRETDPETYDRLLARLEAGNAASSGLPGEGD